MTGTAGTGASSAFERACVRLNQALAWLAGAVLVALMLFVVVEVALRAFGWPVVGAVEVISWLSAIAMALALGYVQLQRSHVAMTLIADCLPTIGRRLLDLANATVALLLFVAVAFYLLRYGIELRASGSLSETLKVVVYPWVFVVAVGFTGLCLALLLDVLRALRAVMRPAR